MYFGRWTGKGSKVTWKRKVDRLVIPCLKNRHLVWSLVCLWTSGSVLELWNLDSGQESFRSKGTAGISKGCKTRDCQTSPQQAAWAVEIVALDEVV